MIGGAPGRPYSWCELVRRAQALAEAGERQILGITGAPGSGKGTVAAKLAADLGSRAALVPMDGFHLAGAELRRLGRLDRKGAPDTFDAAGYVALLTRLRSPSPETVYAPEFHREVEESYAGAIPVTPNVSLVITEGNYLLLDSGPWAEVNGLLDEVWFLAPDDRTRVTRLVARHVHHGRSWREAREWVLGNDERNAALVAPTRFRANLVVLGDPE